MEPSDKTDLPSRLRKLATGTEEWRVQHPVEKCYCMVFDYSNSINPEHSARKWLADFQQRHPEHEHAKYEVAKFRRYNDLERAALDAAAALSSTSAKAGEPDQLHAAIMNLPPGKGYQPAMMETREEIAYKTGHRDARHAAAELVLATLSTDKGA